MYMYFLSAKLQVTKRLLPVYLFYWSSNVAQLTGDFLALHFMVRKRNEEMGKEVVTGKDVYKPVMSKSKLSDCIWSFIFALFRLFESLLFCRIVVRCIL